MVARGEVGEEPIDIGICRGQLRLQLQDVTYCAGGTGPLGNVCPAPELSQKKGLIALKGYSHLTVFSTDAQAIQRVLSRSVRNGHSLLSGSDGSDSRGRVGC